MAITANGQQPERSAPLSTRTAPLFAFHSNFWVNLHQTLMREALLGSSEPKAKWLETNGWLETDVPLPMASLPQSDAEQWKSAVRFYASHFDNRDELWDTQLVHINNDLAAQPDEGLTLNSKGLPPDLASVLRTVAPIYRKYWWPAQNRSNERWIAAQRVRVQALGSKFATALTSALHQPWPSAPIREDVSFYVPKLGNAYTTVDPNHTTISSSSSSAQGLDGFELLFHEASHTFSQTEANAIAVQCGKVHKRCGDLWHALLFYTSAVELPRVLPPDERTSFIPYAYRYNVFRGRWVPYLQALKEAWQPYLDGKTSFRRAIDRLADTLPNSAGPS